MCSVQHTYSLSGKSCELKARLALSQLLLEPEAWLWVSQYGRKERPEQGRAELGLQVPPPQASVLGLKTS